MGFAVCTTRTGVFFCVAISKLDFSLGLRYTKMLLSISSMQDPVSLPRMRVSGRAPLSLCSSMVLFLLYVVVVVQDIQSIDPMPSNTPRQVQLNTILLDCRRGKT